MTRVSRPFTAFAFLFCLLPAACLAQQTGNDYGIGLIYPGGASSLIQASDGMLYGTSVDDGYDGGIIFQINPTTGAYKKIYAFNSVTDGEVPNSIIEGSDGELYGTNIYGGNNGGYTCGAGFACGTVFKVSTAGKFTLLHTFTGNSDGYNPSGGLVQGEDGYYYGVNEYGGGPADDCMGSYTGGCGTVFRVSSTGDFSVVYTFLVDGTTGEGPGGGYPIGNLLQASDGNFYGTAAVFDFDGQYGTVEESYQTIFSVSPGGSEATVYTSTFPENSDPSTTGSPYGLQVMSQLVEGSDGNLYGTAKLGGTSTASKGTLFNMTFGGELTMLAEFPSATTGTATQPNGSLAVGGDGNFYGALADGGANGCGTVFSMTPAGTLTDLFDLYSLDGCGPGPFVPGSIPGQFFDMAGGVYIDQLTVSPNPPAPVQLTLTQPVITIGGTTTLNWQVLNAFSLTMQQCYFFATLDGTSYPEGKLTGTLSNQILGGSVALTPPSPGTYALAITCGGQESGFATLTVNKLTSTNTLTAAPTSVQIGQPVTLTATVAKVAGFAAPTGSVTFYYGSNNLGSATLNSSGVATLKESSAGQPAGTYAIHAYYSGDSLYNALNSPNVNVVLTSGAATTTTLAANPTSVTPPASVTLTATVKKSSGTGTPTGSVTFYYGTLSLGSATLNGGGVATISASSSGQPAGNYPITAHYGGDSNDASSVSAAVSVTVE